ncbi:MAG TPA: 5-formyltetrahydrofolate cyclo-ligase [Chryseosolibacter sp.]|nr:5-formyltetrahydrofolate cyclo-ligase [Chryseosolibacter sp.]
MTKEELRKIYLQKRLAMGEAEYLALNKQICENFFALVDLSFAVVFHSFLPIEKTREPNTWLIIERIRREFPHIRISVPRINNETSLLDNFYFEGLHQLQNNTWGIPEPKQGIPTPTEKIDLVLVPLLAFDSTGHRVGYGRGFYDKFLATTRKDCRKIGLSFFPPVESIDNIHPHDLALDMVVTPQGVLNLVNQ